MKPVLPPLTRALRDLFSLQPLENRLLLSADPVLGAAQIVLAPDEQDPAAALVQAYAAPADVKIETAPDATVLVADHASQGAAPSGWLVVDTAQLGDGNGRVVVGGPDSNAVIQLGSAATGVHAGELVLMNPQAGGEVHVDGRLDLDGSLLVQGSGHTTTLSNDINSTDDVNLLDSVLVNGTQSITAGTDGTGNIQLGNNTSSTLNGNGDATPDTLTLQAPDNVRFTGPVGSTDPLEGITIGVIGSPDLPNNVTFGREVTVNGDLLINASGTVTFAAKVVLASGGDLRISGAGQVVFQGGLELQGTDSGGNAGDVFIEANELDFLGGTESVKGAGSLTLRPTTVAYGIDIGSLPASLAQPGGSTLNLETSELKALADGFSKIVIGHQDGVHANAAAGNVRIGAIDALSQPTLRDPLEVYGGTVSVEDVDNPDYQFLVQGTLKLDAHADITLANRVEANTGGAVTDVSLYADTGRIRQVDATADLRTSEPLRAATLTARAATGISLPFTELATVSATNTASGDLSITETASGGDVAIALLRQQAASAGLSLKTTAGAITVGGTGIENAGSGSTELQAGGSGKAITVNQAIHSTAGAIKLTASGAITTVDDAVNNGTVVSDGAAAVELVASGGAIQQGGEIRSAGGSLSLDASTTLTMADGVRARSIDGAGNGAVSLRARGGNVTVSLVQADGSMSITAAGAIVDGLTGTDPNLDGETAAVLLAAASGIGGSTTPLQTKVDSLAASNTTTGGLFVREATALRIAGGAGSHAIDLAGSDGSMAVFTVDGAITLEKGVRSTGGIGHMLLQSGELDDLTAAGISVRADVSSAAGSITVLSVDGIDADDQLADSAPTVSVGAAGQTLDIEAAAAINAEGSARFATAGGALHLWSDGGDVVLGVVDAGSGTASIVAGGRILDAQADDGEATPGANVIAGSVRLDGAAGIGAAGSLLDTRAGTLAASASGGAIFLAEADDVSVGTVAASTVNRIGTQGTAGATLADGAALSGVASSQSVVLQAAGNLAINQAVSASGHLRVTAGGTLAAAAAVTSTGGNLSALAAGTLSMSATGVFAAVGGGTVELQSTGGAVTLADGAVARTDQATLRVQAAGDVTVGLLDARSAADRAAGSFDGQAAWGTVSVVAGGSIMDNAGETATDVIGQAVRLQAGGGIGSGSEALKLEAGQLSASALAAGVFLTEATAAELQPLGAVTVQRVDSDGTSDAGPEDDAQAGIASAGALVLRTLAGSITVGNGATVSAGGNVLLDAQGGSSDLSLGSLVTSSAGHVSLLSARDLLLNADVAADGSGKTIDLRAARHVQQAQGTTVSSNDGNIAVEAVAGDATLESLVAGSGGAWISAASIIDGDAAGDGEVDLAAASAQLLATGSIGAAGAALETQVATLTASAGSAVFIAETDGLAVDGLQLDVQRVQADGSAAGTAHAAQEDLAAATLVLTSTTGDITVNAGTAATAGVRGGVGNTRLEAVAGNLVADALIDAGSGHVSLLGAAGVNFAATAGVTTTAGTIDIESGAGAVSMADGSTAQTADQIIRLRAATDVTVGRLDAGDAGSISILAGGAIADNAGETAVDVLAGVLRLEAGGGIGSGDEALETDVASLTALAGAGGLFLLEESALLVSQAGPISVNRVGADGTTLTAQTDGVQTGLTSGGALVLQTADGAITTNVQGTISAAGNLLLRADGTGADLWLAAAVTSSGGSIELAATQDVLLGADVSTGTAGKSVVAFAGRDVTQEQGTSVTTVDGGILLEAGGGGTVTIETLSAGSAGVQVSGGGIVDGDASGDSEADILADRLALTTSGGIAGAGAELETTVGTLAARASGDVFLAETDGLALDTVVVAIQQVDASGAAQDISLPANRGLVGANVVLRAAGGITSTAGTAATTTGNLLLQADGAAADLTLAGSIAAGGAASLLAGHDIVLTGSVAATGGSVDLQAQGRIDAQQGSAISAADANVQLLALGGSVTLESVAAGTGTVRISGTNLIDGDGTAGEAEVDITAGALLLTATQAAGTGANPLETTVDTLSVNAGGIVGIVESEGLVLDTVTASVDRVGVDGTTTATAPVAQSNVSGTTVTIRTLAGALTGMAAGGAVTASGNLLLKAGGALGDLTLGAAVASSGGNISVDAGRDLLQAAAVSTATAGRTIDLLAAGDLTQAQGSSLATTNGHAALTAGGALTIESVSAGIGRVSLGGASIVDGDADGDADADVLAAGVRATATDGGIGSAANPLETTISTLSAVASGDVFVDETDALDLAVVSATVNRVAANGADAAVSFAAQNNVSGATVVVRALAGSLTSQATGAVSATGNLLLAAAGAASDVNLGAAVASTGGHVSLSAARDLVLGANVTASGASRSVDLLVTGNFQQAQGTRVAAAGGNIALQAGGDATIETFDAGAGQVRLAAASIADGDATANETEVDILAAGLQLLATDGAAGSGANPLETSVQTLAATATGDLFITESDALTVGTLAVDVQRVDASGAAAATANAATTGVLAAASAIRTLAGTLDNLASAAIATSGNLLLQAGGAGSDLLLAGAVTGGLDLTLDAARDLQLGADVSASTAGRSLVLAAGGDFRQAQGTTASVNDGAIALSAGGAATLERLQAGTGVVRVAAAGIVDGDAALDSEVDILASGLQLVATGAIGSATNALETAVATLALSSGGAAFVGENDTLALQSVTVATQRVAADATSQAPVSHTLAGASSGAALVLQAGGSITSDAQGTVSAAGNLLLSALGAASDLSLGAAVASSAGHASLLAGHDLLLGASVSTAGAGKTIDLRAQRHVVQSQGTAVTSTDGHIAVEAATGNATLESLVAGGGGLWVGAVNIVDGDAAGDVEVDLRGASAQLVASGAIGASGAALESTVGTLAARAAGDLFLTESDALTVGALATDVRRVAADASAASTAHAPLAGLAGANVVVRTSAGALATEAATTATGRLLLQAGGAAGDLRLGANVTAAGALSVVAGRDLNITAALTTSTAGSTIDLRAQGALVAAQGSLVRSANANVLLQAGGDVTLERVEAGTGTVRIAGARVIDGDSGAGESEVDIAAAQLQVSATQSVGSAANPLETAVGTLSISAGGAVRVAESDAVRVSTVTFGGVNRVGADGAAAATGVLAQGDLVANGGDAVLSAGGALDVAASQSVRSGGGELRLAAQGALTVGEQGSLGTAGGKLTLGAQAGIALGDSVQVQSAGGAVAMTAVADLVLGDAVRVRSAGGAVGLSAGAGFSLGALGSIAAGSGAVTVRADGGDLALGDTASVTGGAVTFTAAADLTLADRALVMGSGAVALTAQGDLALGDAAAVTGTAGDVTLTAGSDLTLGDLAAVRGTAGDVTLTAGGNLALGDSATVSGTGGDVTLTAGGTLALGDSATVSGTGGDVTLTAGGTAAFAAHAAVGSSGGQLTVSSQGAFTAAEAVRFSTTGAALSLASQAGLALGDQVQVASAGGAVALSARADLSLGEQGRVDAGSGAASLTAQGALALAEAARVAGAAVKLDATGKLALAAAASVAGTAAVSVTSAAALSLGDSATISATGADATLGAGGALTLAARAAITSDGGQLRATSAGEFSAGTGASFSTTGGALTLASQAGLVLGDEAVARSAGGAIGLTAADAFSLGARGRIAGGSGAVAIAAQGGVLALGADAALAGGAVTLDAAGDLTLADQVRVVGRGAVALASDAALSLGANANVTAIGADATLGAGGPLTLASNAVVASRGGRLQASSQGEFTAGTGASLTATGGALTLASQAGMTLGDDAVATSADAAISLTAADAFWLGARGSVGAGSGAVAITAQGGALALGATAAVSGGAVTLDSKGDLTLAGHASVEGAGTLSLASGAALSLGDGASVTARGADATLAAGSALTLAAQAAVTSVGGQLRADSQGEFSAGTGAMFTTTSGALTLASQAGIALGDEAMVRSAGGGIALAAADAFSLGARGKVASGSGDVAITAQGGALVLGGSTTVAGRALTLDAAGELMLGDQALVAGRGAVWLASGAALSLGDTARVSASGADATLRAGGDLALAARAAVTSDGGRLVASSQGEFTAGTGASFTTTGGALQLGSRGGLTLGAQAAVGSAGGPIALTTSASFALGARGSVDAGGGSVAITAQGGDLALGDTALVDAGGDATLRAGGALRLDAHAEVASTGGRLAASSQGDFSTGSAAAFSTRGGALNLESQRALDLGDAVQVRSVGGAISLAAGAGFTLGSGGSIGAGTGALAVSAGGAIVLAEQAVLTTAAGPVAISSNGDLALGARAVIRGGSDPLTLSAGGNMLLGNASWVRSTGGDTRLTSQGRLAFAADADLSAGGGDVAISARDSITMAAGADVLTAGTATIDVVSAAGRVLMDPDASSLATGSGDIHVTAEGDIQPGVLATQGQAFLDSRHGRVLVRGELQRSGGDLDLFGDDLVIDAPVSSPGGALRLGPADAGVPVVVGDRPAAPGTLQIDTGELRLLRDGFSRIEIGSALPKQVLVLDGTARGLEFHDPLLLSATGAGGNVVVRGSVSGETLTIADSGGRTILADSTLSLRGDVLVQDQLKVDGANAIEAGQGGRGTLRLTGAVTGAGGAADTLALAAHGGRVLLDQAVTGLDGLRVTEASDVTFGSGVSLTGDLVIEATGTVTFKGPLTLSDGAQLVVRGGGRVVFAGDADLGGGRALLQVSGIRAGGGAGSLHGAGVLLIQGTTRAGDIHIGRGSASPDTLVVGNDVLRAVGADVGRLQIGSAATAAAGAISIGAADLSATGAPVRILGSTITLAGTGSGVRVGTGLELHAEGAIETSGRLTATAASDLRFTSDSGAVTMAADARVTSLGGRIALHAATGLTVARLDARGDGGAGTVSLQADHGKVRDARADLSVDVFAGAVDFAGRGFAVGSAAVLEVSAPIVRIDPAGGLLLRESGTNGRIYYSVLHGGADLEQLLVAVGTSQGFSPDGGGFTVAGGVLALGLPHSALASALGASPGAAAPTVNAGVHDYLGGAGLVQAQLSQRLQAAGELSFASGLPAGGWTGADYWTETLAV